MSTAYDTPVRPAPESTKIHSGRYAHDRLPARPCSATPAWHLRNNNLLGLQAAFQCGTVHHHCTGVDLAKATDNEDHRVTGGDTTKIDNYLGQWEGPVSDQTRDDLAKNDLRGLDNVLYLMEYDPTPGQ
jgi:hypothetical protein